MKFSFTSPQTGTYTTDSISEYASFIQGNDLGGYFLAMLGVLVIAVLFLAAWCRLFYKAGLPWERVFVPCYGGYWQHKVAGCSALYWAGLVLSVLLVFEAEIASLIGQDAWIMIQAVIFIVWFVCYCIHCVKLSKSFGHGVGFGIGLVLFNFIFIPILGLGKSEYVGEYK